MSQMYQQTPSVLPYIVEWLTIGDISKESSINTKEDKWSRNPFVECRQQHSQHEAIQQSDHHILGFELVFFKLVKELSKLQLVSF